MCRKSFRGASEETARDSTVCGSPRSTAVPVISREGCGRVASVHESSKYL